MQRRATGDSGGVGGGGPAGKQPGFKTCILYSYYKSTSCRRVHAALLYKGIDVEIKPVDLARDEQRTPKFLALNPMGEVPVLIIDNLVLTQSRAIVDYIDERFPKKPLMPKDVLQRFQVQEIVGIIETGISPFTNVFDCLDNIVVLLRGYNTIEDKLAAKDEWCARVAARGLEALEKKLRVYSGTYCVGESLTLADIWFVPLMNSVTDLGLDLAPYPALRAMEANLNREVFFYKSRPNFHPGCPNEFALNPGSASASGTAAVRQSRVTALGSAAHRNTLGPPAAPPGSRSVGSGSQRGNVMPEKPFSFGGGY